MHVTPLELGLAVAILVVAFGPKKLPQFNKQEEIEKVDLSMLAPRYHAAARAPSPLSVERASVDFVPRPRKVAAEAPYQYAQASKLPHEF
jgi:hypothetical protein